MPYYDEKKKKYVSKYTGTAALRCTLDDYRGESEREKEIARIVARMEDIPPEYMLDDSLDCIAHAKKRSRKERKIAKKK